MQTLLENANTDAKRAIKVCQGNPWLSRNRSIMLVLGIETSGRAGSVALQEDDLRLGEIELNATGRRHARTLIPEIRNLFFGASRSFDDLDGVAVSLGPGSFTGLRVGVVCAKTLAYVTGCKIIGVDTFAAVAAQSTEEGVIWVIDDALRGDVFAGKYRIDGATVIECLVSPMIIDAEELKLRIENEDLISGPGIEKLSPMFDAFRTVDAKHRRPMASKIAEFGVAQVSKGDCDDPWRLKPVYLRRSAAEEKLDVKSTRDSESSC